MRRLGGVPGGVLEQYGVRDRDAEAPQRRELHTHHTVAGLDLRLCRQQPQLSWRPTLRAASLLQNGLNSSGKSSYTTQFNEFSNTSWAVDP